MSADPLIRVTGLRKTFGNHRVLDGVDLDVRAGEAVAMLGANGAGKTTLLKILATLVRPTRGTAAVAGHDCARDAERARLHIGLVAHGSYVYEDLTALENLKFWTTLAGLRPTAAALAGALARVELERAADERVRTFSAGMKRRLSLARFVLARPSVLLLDEPFAGLSIEERRDVLALVTGIPRDVTIVMIEHDMDVALDFAERITVLHFGEVVMEGTRTEVVAHPRTREIYLGE